MLSAEERTTGKQERCCHECGGPIREGEDHAVMEVYDSPWGPPVEIAVHADNADNPWDTCESRLTDTGWAGFRYFDCDCCGRRICRQSRSNGWHSHVRVYRGREICLRCFQGIQLWEGASRESFESGRVEGMYYANGDLTASGFEPVSGFFGYEIGDEDKLKTYCAAALKLIERGHVIVNEFDLMKAGDREGFVTMWRRGGEGLGLEPKWA